MIEIKDLSFSYKREQLFTGMDLSLSPGNIYGLLGKNGAGKTTLLKLICGLRFPKGGECTVMGFTPADRPARLLEEICFISEEMYVPPIMPALFEKIYAPLYPRFNHGVFQEYVREFELDWGKKLTEQSAGQKKKFLLAFGLASSCRILLMDEPTNGLDIPSKTQFRRLLARSAAEDQIILISTHQVRDMENLIDPIIILDQGKIIFQEPLQEAARRLSVSLEREAPPEDSVVYAEKTLGGYVVVRENHGGEETNVDLETLFNAVIGNREKIVRLFSGKTAAGKGA